jgi:uncharacterized protein YbcV (DUF1398 family)
MDQATIESIEKRAADEKWTYPTLFDALRDAGVERYEVNVPRHETRFVGGKTSFTLGAPAGFTPLAVGTGFDLAAIKNTLGRVQRGEIDYIAFLAGIAAAGVAFYRVDMKPRTVTYHGPTPKNKLVESVPPSTPA